MTGLSVAHRLRWSRDAVGRRARIGSWLALLALAGLLGGCSAEPAGEPADPVPAPALSREQLERAKLEAETRAIREKTAREASLAASALRWAPFLTALVALGGVGLGLRTQRKDRQVERRRRHDEELARTVQSLGSDSAKVRLNAAAAVTAFLGPDSADLHVDLLNVVMANLRIETDNAVADVLVRDLEIALRECLRRAGHLKEIDLARSLWLVRLDLSELDLSGIPVDLAFANLERANLSGLRAPRSVRGWGVLLNHARLSRANLHEARLNAASAVGARFHQAQLVSATFKQADLRTAQFHRARLQSAHFEGARLRGAVFTMADVTDTWFCDSRQANPAELDEAALRTLSRARDGSWRRAHLAPEHRAAVEAFASPGRAGGA
jgi:uncharacterized protein YjbI with pentapeptide repeats